MLMLFLKNKKYACAARILMPIFKGRNLGKTKYYSKRKVHHLIARCFFSGGIVKEGKKCLWTPFDIAEEVFKDLVLNSLFAKVNEVLRDMSRPLEGSC